MKEPVDVVDRQIQAYVACDIEGFVATYEANAICCELPSGRVLAEGRDAIRRVWGDLFARGPRTFRLKNRVVLGHFVTDLEEVGIEGEERLIQAMVVYRVSDNGISHAWFLVEDDA